MVDFPTWECHKKVRAAEIVRVDAVWASALDTERPTHYRVTVKIDDRAGHEIVDVPTGAFAREVDERGTLERCLGAFLVIYDDGHISWSPREAFLAGYRQLGQPDAGGSYIGLERTEATG